jgi:hypothetical protein
MFVLYILQALKGDDVVSFLSLSNDADERSPSL